MPTCWLLTYLTLRNGRPDLLLSVFSTILRSDKGRALKPQYKWHHSEAKLSWDTDSSYSAPVGKRLGALAFDRVEQLTTASRTLKGRGAWLPRLSCSLLGLTSSFFTRLPNPHDCLLVKTFCCSRTENLCRDRAASNSASSQEPYGLPRWLRSIESLKFTAPNPRLTHVYFKACILVFLFK